MRSRVRPLCVQRFEEVRGVREEGLKGGGWSADDQGRGVLRRRVRVAVVVGWVERSETVVVRGIGRAEREADVVEVRVWGWSREEGCAIVVGAPAVLAFASREDVQP